MNHVKNGMITRAEQPDIAAIRQTCNELARQWQAEELFQWSGKALAMNPHESDFIGFRAMALCLLGRHTEAADMWTRAPLCSGDPMLYRLRIGYNLMMACDCARAIPVLDEARRIVAPGNNGMVEQYLGEALLKLGDSRGFAHWQGRNEIDGSYCPVGIPAWAGESDLRNQRVLVMHQLGFGDNFLLDACVKDWLDAGAKVMLSCEVQTHALMQASLPECDVVIAPRPLHPRTPLPDEMRAQVNAFAPNLYTTLLHLPLLKAGRTASGYRFSPYIHASLEKQQIATKWAKHLRAQYPGKKLVGLFWDCYQRHVPEANNNVRWWARRRSLPLDAVNRIVMDRAIASKVHFVNLHHPVTEAAVGTPAGNVSRYRPAIWNFDDTAACIGQLDAVVAVDSGVANLATMMGVTTCVPVNTSSDWRWGCSGTTSPWIDNVTVLHQIREGDWAPVVRDIVAWLLRYAHR